MKTSAAIEVEGLKKSFTLHAQGGAVLDVLDGLSLAVSAGECVALDGPSGAGKSTVLRCIYGNYLVQSGRIVVRHHGGETDVAAAGPREILGLRRDVVGCVTQFLRAVPRVPALDVVAEPILARGATREDARDRARALLERLRIPERMWRLAPATFSGGEQQRVNVARGLGAGHPVMLLDEPTASLDRDNRRAVIELILDARHRGTAVLGIFHDAEVREALADRLVPLAAGGIAA